MFGGIQHLEMMVFFGFATNSESVMRAYNSFINRMDGVRANQFQRKYKINFSKIEVLLTLNILLYDIDIMIGNVIGELSRFSVRKYEKSGRLLIHKRDMCFVTSIDPVFYFLRCSICNIFSAENSFWNGFSLCSLQELNLFFLR